MVAFSPTSGSGWQSGSSGCSLKDHAQPRPVFGQAAGTQGSWGGEAASHSLSPLHLQIRTPGSPAGGDGREHDLPDLPGGCDALCSDLGLGISAPGGVRTQLGSSPFP